jgi:hypothetical protein
LLAARDGANEHWFDPLERDERRHYHHRHYTHQHHHQQQQRQQCVESICKYELTARATPSWVHGEIEIPLQRVRIKTSHVLRQHLESAVSDEGETRVSTEQVFLEILPS